MRASIDLASNQDRYHGILAKRNQDPRSRTAAEFFVSAKLPRWFVGFQTSHVTRYVILNYKASDRMINLVISSLTI